MKSFGSNVTSLGDTKIKRKDCAGTESVCVCIPADTETSISNELSSLDLILSNKLTFQQNLDQTLLVLQHESCYANCSTNLGIKILKNV